MANAGSVIYRLQIDEIGKFRRSLRVIFRLPNLKLGHSDDAFNMFHVLFANRVVSSHFLRDEKLEKKM